MAENGCKRKNLINIRFIDKRFYLKKMISFICIKKSTAINILKSFFFISIKNKSVLDFPFNLRFIFFCQKDLKYKQFFPNEIKLRKVKVQDVYNDNG